MNKTIQIADSGGAFGAIFAALCCAGTPFIVAGLAAAGLSFFRTDSILLPLMGVSLLIALWGFWQGWRLHKASGPFGLAIVGAVALVAGVVFVHGSPAKALIWGASLVLVAATVWNVTLRRSCEARAAT